MRKTTVPSFITFERNSKQELTYPTEVAIITSLAELQRKKSGLLRDMREKLASLSKTYYPFWIAATENLFVLVDGLNVASHKFSYKEPRLTSELIENLKKSTVNAKSLLETIVGETKKASEFTCQKSVTFRAVIANRELLDFFPHYIMNDNILDECSPEEKQAIPSEIDGKTASETSKAVVNCFRTIKANMKGLEYAIQTLNQETETHKRTTAYETELLKQKNSDEIAALKPEVEKEVKKLTQKYEKLFAAHQKTSDRKIALQEKKCESYLDKLGKAEKRKSGAQKRVSSAKKKKASYSSFEINRYSQEVENLKKKAKAASEAVEKLKKEADSKTKQLNDEFEKAVASAEDKINQENAKYQLKIQAKEKQLETLLAQAANLQSNLKKIINDLKASSAALKQQVELNWKSETEEPVRVLIPVYIAIYEKEKEQRTAIFSPITVAEDTGIVNEMRKILNIAPESQLKTFTRYTSKNLQDILTTNLSEKIKTDQAFLATIVSLGKAGNVLNTIEFAQTLNEGLDEIVKQAWMTPQEAAIICSQIMENKT